MVLFPVRCFTCGNVIEPLSREYNRRVSQLKSERGIDPNKVVYFTAPSSGEAGEETVNLPTVEAEVLDSLGVKALCCRIPFLTQPRSQF